MIRVTMFFLKSTLHGAVMNCALNIEKRVCVIVSLGVGIAVNSRNRIARLQQSCAL